MAMDFAERRVRSLKLRGWDEGQLQQARVGLEEAFRLATLPGFPPNATVLVRYLDLGTIRSGVSPIQLAAVITEALRRLPATALRIDQDPGPDAELVWYDHPLQPYQALLGRLLDGRPVNEWYWRSFRPAAAPGLDEAAITETLLAGCRTPVEALGVPLLLTPCLGPRRLSRLLSVLTTGLAIRVLQEQGMLPEPTVAAATRDDRRHSGGPDQGPVLLFDAALIDPAWRKAIRAAVEHWGAEDIRSRWLGLQALIRHRPGYLAHRDTWHALVLEDWLDCWTRGSTAGPPDRRSRPESRPDGRSLRRPQPGRDARNATELLDRPSTEEHPGRVGEPAANSEPEDQHRAAGVRFATDHAAWGYSRMAGFAYLVPLLQRLGMEELLARNAVLIAADFPRQLLWALAARFGMERDDPGLPIFDALELTPELDLGRIACPPSWQRLSVTVRHHACFSFVAQPRMRLQELVRGLQLLGALYLRRYCKLSMRSLIGRPGRIAITPTHWDASFDIKQTDLRLRRVALDCDPGWLPWLGRVVRFHYEDDGKGHG